jgi:hypothetical protein
MLDTNTCLRRDRRDKEFQQGMFTSLFHKVNHLQKVFIFIDDILIYNYQTFLDGVENAREN